MRRTLFEIPYEVGGVPLFGLGVLLAIWAVLSVGWLGWLVYRHGVTSETMGHVPLLAILGAAIYALPRVFPEALPIRGYGVMLLLAVTAGVMLAAHRARKMGVHPDLIFSLAFWLFIAGIAGARLFHVIEYWDSYRRETVAATLRAIADIPSGGLVVYGSLIGAALAFFWFVRRHKLPALALADLVAPSLVLGVAIGRMGCLLNGCCYGGACELPWAVTFPQKSPPYERFRMQGQRYGFELQAGRAGEPVIGPVTPDSPADQAGLKSGETIVGIGELSGEVAAPRSVETMDEAIGLLRSMSYASESIVVQTATGKQALLSPGELPSRSPPLHPAQVYSAINAFLLCLFLLAYYPFRRRDGEVLALLLTLYPFTRFLLEIIRTDESAVFRTGMSISQNVSLILAAAVVGLWVYIARQPKGSALPPGAVARSF